MEHSMYHLERRTINLNIKAEKTGEFFIHFSGLYYPDDNKDMYNPISLTHPLTVEEPSKDPYDPSPTQQLPESTPTPKPMEIPLTWIITIFAVLIGIAIIFAVRRKGGETVVEIDREK
ncbi:MAG: hypothetical protein SVM80_02715 [Halobacteriota archaeon]|nr:hypothetical protein [Halobacteriota archaeon]